VHNDYVSQKLEEFKHLIDEGNLTSQSWYVITGYTNNHPIHQACDTPDIVLGKYTISACNVGTNVAGLSEVSYGNYYTYDEALTICPSGYHLPSKEEWEGLYTLGVKQKLWSKDEGYKFVRSLQLPLAGMYFFADQRIEYAEEGGDYRTATIGGYDSVANALVVRPYSYDFENVVVAGSSGRGNHYSVRCFKTTQ
jgi:uncharacterized protein (TIGR02145 family)